MRLQLIAADGLLAAGAFDSIDPGYCKMAMSVRSVPATQEADDLTFLRPFQKCNKFSSQAAQSLFKLPGSSGGVRGSWTGSMVNAKIKK